MGSLYYVDAADLLRAAGLTVVESDGWQHRARNSGGFESPPLGVQWHHTASHTSPANDIAWQTEGSDDAPIGNATIMRDGSVWMVAAGAANTAGKGGPWTFSRGTCPQDGANSRTWAFEVANDGVGEGWPQVQIDAYFTASNTMNRRFGNRPDDILTHQRWAPTRKIDPATAEAVQGPWRPSSCTEAGTWDLDDIKAECLRRAETEEDEVTDEDIDRIVDAVWRRTMTFRPTNKQMSAEDLLETTAHYACNADMNTRSEE